MAYNQYELDWKLGQKKWVVIKADSTSGLAVGDELRLTGVGGGTASDLEKRPSGGSWTNHGANCTHMPASDEVEYTRGGTKRARRRICLIGPDAASGGVTWVAEEGG